MLALNSFNADQSCCKECNNDRRRFGRLVQSQAEEQWWEALQRENYKASQKTLRNYHQTFKKNGSKSKFSIVQHKRRLKKASGVRRSKKEVDVGK